MQKHKKALPVHGKTRHGTGRSTAPVHMSDFAGISVPLLKNLLLFEIINEAPSNCKHFFSFQFLLYL